MKSYILEVTLEAPALIGSGEGFGAVIDTDVVFDDKVGLPYIPAKRIKGCLKDAAEEVYDIFECSQIDGYAERQKHIAKTFGEPGKNEPAPVYFSDLRIRHHKENFDWLLYYLEKNAYPNILSKERILETFTEIRQQTAIDENIGTAQQHSLRSVRVLKTGLVFSGDVTLEKNEQSLLNTLQLACANFRRLGTKRNRGFGDIRCQLLHQNGAPLPPLELLEELCTQ